MIFIPPGIPKIVKTTTRLDAYFVTRLSNVDIVPVKITSSCR